MVLLMKGVCVEQEALHREKMLEQKLGSLQQLVLTTQQAAEGGWQVRHFSFFFFF